MFSASPAAAPTTPAATGLYKGIGSSPPHNAAGSSSSGDGISKGGGGGGGGGMGFLYGAGGSVGGAGGRRGGVFGGFVGAGRSSGGVDEDQAPQSAFQRLCALLGLLTRAAGAATMAVNALLFLAAASLPAQHQPQSLSAASAGAADGGASGGSSLSDQEQPEFSSSPFSAEALIRLYSVGFGLCILLSETEWGPLALRQHLAFLETWALRGLFLLFVGALLHFPPSSSSPYPSSSSLFGPDSGSSDNTSSSISAMEGAKGDGGYLGGFQRLVGQTLVGLGCAYCALGVLCFRALKQRQLSRARRRKKQAMAQELHAMHLQKHEIERLLTDTESKLQHL